MIWILTCIHVPRIRRYAQNNKRSCEEVRKLYEGSAADSNLFMLHRVYQYPCMIWACLRHPCFSWHACLAVCVWWRTCMNMHNWLPRGRIEENVPGKWWELWHCWDEGQKVLRIQEECHWYRSKGHKETAQGNLSLGRCSGLRFWQLFHARINIWI